MTTPLRIAVLVGSTRDGRFAPVVSGWLARRLADRANLTVDVVDLAEHELPTVLPAFGQPPRPGTTEALAEVSPRLAAADAFVIVTPEYNHSYPASLKNAIDWHDTEWHGKPVGFVSYGGVSGGLRAVEHLRHVLAELNAMTIRETVSFAGAWERFDAEGNADAGGEKSLTAFLDQLTWWGLALREARAARPFGTVAA
ncbi:FMN reductase [Actinorhabdospora filicis]|uniref:FMN reductase n=1 Tax=Actinorhabdospora filicis TaxID=1785913 RepID=A0A9W6WD05_9ACTN|nr:NAD(P)H-dependent oxidoreductase [Actinorhabdospora filicis]GLZ81623.1 FMN reductase [Actinorhabdospora filicis]